MAYCKNAEQDREGEAKGVMYLYLNGNKQQFHHGEKKERVESSSISLFLFQFIVLSIILLITKQQSRHQ